MFWWLTITTVPCHIAKFTRLSRSLHGAKSYIDQDIVVFCPCYYYTLEDLGHCPILGRGQEVRVAVFSALHSDWTACLCQRRFPQFNAPCRNKTHSVGSYVYSSNVEAKLIMRADYRLYIARWRLFIQHALCTPDSRKKIAYFYILEASPRPFSVVVTMIYIAVVPLLISYILITQYHVHIRIHLCQSYRFLCSDW